MDYGNETMAEGATDGVTVHSGFPNPAAGKTSSRPALDLNQLLIRHPSSTYLFRIRGHIWEERGIFDGDIALIDRALTPRPGDLVITWQDQTFTITPFSQLKKDTTPWGTLTATIHQYDRAS